MVWIETSEDYVVPNVHVHRKGKAQELRLPWYGRWGNRLHIFFIFLLLLFSLGLIAIGIVMIFINEPLQRSEIKAMFNDMNFTGSLKVGNVMNSLPFLCISVGGVILMFFVVGCVSRVKKNQIMLTVFTILLIWFLIVQILTSVMWVMVKDKFNDDVKNEMAELFVLYDGNQNDITRGWDYIFIDYECCGVDSITASTNKYAFNATLWWANRDSNLTLVPTSCCSRATEDNYLTYTDTDCQRILLAQHKKGCYDAIVDWLEYFWNPAIVFSAFMIAIEALLIIISCMICCGVRRAKEIR